MLKPKQKKFVESYLKSGNATAAAIDAGYSAKSARSWGSRLLAMPDVQEYRRELEQKLFEEMGISKAWIGRRLVEVVDRCMQATPHMSWNDETRQKEPDGFWQFEAANAIKAMHELYIQLDFAQGSEETQEQRDSFEDWLARQDGVSGL